MGCALIGCGKAVPALDVENDSLRELVDTNDEWISSRTGIKSRRIAVAETNADLGEAAARAALGWSPEGYAPRNTSADDIDLLIYATVTPDVLVPSAAGLIRRRLGLHNAIAFDINAACSGFVYGLTIVEAFMAAASSQSPGHTRRNPIRRALVVGSERLTRLTNWYDRNTCVLFGDGAGAAVVEWNPEKAGILGSYLVNEDDETNALTCALNYPTPQPFDSAGISKCTDDRSSARIDAELGITDALAQGEMRQALRMDGARVFKFAAEAMTEAIHQALKRAGISLQDIACIIPHQANERIIKYAAKKLNRPLDFFQVSIAHAGNTSAASVPMALCDAYTTGRIHAGDKVVLVAFGGGFTSGAVVFEA